MPFPTLTRLGCGLSLAVATLGSGCTASRNTPTINHIAVYVYDLPKSVAFYKDALQLPEIPEPFHDGKHVWLRLGPHAQLHLIQGATSVIDHDKNAHLAFHVKDLNAFAARLTQLHIPYGSWTGEANQTTPRPDGIKQVYLQDPDGFWVEVNDDRF